MNIPVVDEFGVRRLDIKVAEVVFGWSIDPGLPNETAFLYPPEWNDELKGWPSSKIGGQQKTSDALVPYYSKNIFEAFSVVEEIRNSQKVCCFTMQSDYNYVWEVTWVFSADRTHTKHSLSQSYEELPIAICYAALKIFKAQEEKEVISANHDQEKYDYACGYPD